MNGPDILAEFRRNPSDPGFAGLIRRHTNFVYSVAQRRLSNAALAEEVTQVVFIRLARTAPRLPTEADLMAWLHRTTVNVSIDFWRVESRRRHREDIAAAAMQLHAPDTAPAWDDLALVVDEALNELSDTDRQALLLRYFQEQPMRALGVVLGVNEDAAKMRVSRALGRLKESLGRRGITCTAAALGALLDERAVAAAPAPVGAALARISFVTPGGAGFVAAMLHLVRGSIGLPMAAGLAVLLTGVGAWQGSRLWASRDAAMAGDISADAGATNGFGAMAAGVTNDVDLNGAAEGLAGAPDPTELLRGVVNARLRAISGSTDWLITVEGLENGHRETKQWNVSIRFADGKLRSDQLGREYRYTAIGEAGEAQAARIEQEKLDRATAVRLGLLQPFESRVVSIYDGEALMVHRSTPGRSGSTQIEKAGHGGGGYLFDPRVIGLATALYEGASLETHAGHRDPKVIAIAGREAVDGVPAWHVRLLTRYDEWLSYWIDIERPGRVLKFQEGVKTLVSKYESRTDNFPIPTEVLETGGAPGRFFTVTRVRYQRGSANFNQGVDVSSFTLAGLGMEVGTSVTDVRIHRTIGYWNGAGLSPRPAPAKPASKRLTPPDIQQLTAAMENDPASEYARQSAIWIVENTPDGALVEQAAQVIEREHLRNTNMASFCDRLETARPRCSTNLLAGFLRENPSVDIRAKACFHLAGLYKEASGFGTNVEAAALAIEHFDRVISEFATAGPLGAELARKSRPELRELRHIIIGRPAPETRGGDLHGEPLDLADFRGRIVVLVFWTDSTDSDQLEQRRIFEKVPPGSVTFVGVYNGSDRDKAIEASTRRPGDTWPTFWDPERRLMKVWNVNHWLSTVLMDKNGIIRERDLRGHELATAIAGLVGK